MPVLALARIVVHDVAASAARDAAVRAILRQALHRTPPAGRSASVCRTKPSGRTCSPPSRGSAAGRIVGQGDVPDDAKRTTTAKNGESHRELARRRCDRGPRGGGDAVATRPPAGPKVRQAVAP